MFKWLHHLLNPHCLHCVELIRESKICQSCETLRSQLAESNYEKKQLLARVLNSSHVIQAEKTVEQEEEPLRHIPPKHLPWPAMRARLEEQDRLKALELDKEKAIRADIDKRNAELEKEVLGEVNHA
jgi:hypothetical protein